MPHMTASLLTAALKIVLLLIFRITILLFFFACGWFPVTAEGRENSQEECVSAADSCQSRVSERRGGGGRGRGPSFLLYLSLIYRSSLSPCLVIALSLTFYSPHSLLRLTWITLLIKLTLDFKLPSWESDVLRLIVCHCLDFSPLLSFQGHQSFFLPQAEKMNSMQGVDQIYSVNTLTCISLFTVSPLC